MFLMLKHGFVIFSGIRSATHTSKSLARALHTRRHIFPTWRSPIAMESVSPKRCSRSISRIMSRKSHICVDLDLHESSWFPCNMDSAVFFLFLSFLPSPKRARNCRESREGSAAARGAALKSPATAFLRASFCTSINCNKLNIKIWNHSSKFASDALMNLFLVFSLIRCNCSCFCNQTVRKKKKVNLDPDSCCLCGAVPKREWCFHGHITVYSPVMTLKYLREKRKYWCASPDRFQLISPPWILQACWRKSEKEVTKNITNVRRKSKIWFVSYFYHRNPTE